MYSNNNNNDNNNNNNNKYKTYIIQYKYFYMRITDNKIKVNKSIKKSYHKKLYVNKSIKSCLEKVCFESLFKRCEGLSVSDLHWKTVPQFWHHALADPNRAAFLDQRLYLDWGATAIRSTRYCGASP